MKIHAEVTRYAYKNHIILHRVQAAQLQYYKGQEGSSGEDRDQEVLQILQETYYS